MRTDSRQIPQQTRYRAIQCLAVLVAGLVVNTASGQTAEPSFPVTRFVVTGATQFSTEELASATSSLIGPARTFADLQKARAAIMELYAVRGFRTVEVVLPPQEIGSGEVRLQVVEQRVSRVLIQGNQSFSETNIRASIPAVREGELPNVREVNRNLRVANESFAKQTAVTFAPAKTPGEIDTTVRVQEQAPYQFFASIDNTGTPQTGSYRIGVGLRYANLFDRDHVLNVQYVTAPHRASHPSAIELPPSPDVTIFGAGYRIPLYALGDSLEFTAGYSNVNSGTLQNLFAVSGSGTVYAARYHHNLGRIGEYDHRLTFSLDWRNYRNNVQPLAGGSSLVPDLSVHPLSLSYSGVLAGQNSQTAFSAGVARNVPGGSNGDAAAIEAARAGADPHYTIWRYGLSHLGALPKDMQWRFVYEGQWTRDMLVAGEQFGLGGANSIRGFREREVVDDRGWRGSLELYSSDYGSRLADKLRTRMLAFYDRGRTERVNPMVLETSGQTIASAGIGARLSFGAGLSLRVDYAVVLDPGGTRRRNDTFLHASLTYVF